MCWVPASWALVALAGLWNVVWTKRVYGGSMRSMWMWLWALGVAVGCGEKAVDGDTASILTEPGSATTGTTGTSTGAASTPTTGSNSTTGSTSTKGSTSATGTSTTVWPSLPDMELSLIHISEPTRPY